MYRKRRAIKTTSVRAERMRVCGSLYREGGHCTGGEVEEPEIEAPREKPRLSKLFRRITTVSGSKQPKNRTQRQPSRNLLGKCLRDKSSPVAQFGAAALSALSAISQRSRHRVDRARGRSRGRGRGGQLAKRAVEKA